MKHRAVASECDEKVTLKGWQYVIIALTFAGAFFVPKLPFSNELAKELNTVSAWLCETLMNGMSVPVDRLGTRLHFTSQVNAFNLDFRDGGLILNQLYLIVPVSVYLSMEFKSSVFKLLSVGFLATAVGLCYRAVLLGFNAAIWGQQAAAGWLDLLIRVVVVLIVLLIMVGVRRKGAKPCESNGLKREG